MLEVFFEAATFIDHGEIGRELAELVHKTVIGLIHPVDIDRLAVHDPDRDQQHDCKKPNRNPTIDSQGL